MLRPPLRLLQTWSAFALVVAVGAGAGACSDRGNGRAGVGEAGRDTGTTPVQKADTASMPLAAADTVASATRRDTSSAAGTRPVAGGRVAGKPDVTATAGPDTTATAKPDTSGAAAAASLDSLHPFMPVNITVEVPPTPTRPRVLRSVRAGRHAGFERVVFEMAGDTLPGYRITYVEPPAVACGSGQRVSLAGRAVLLVRLAPAQAHDDAGRSTIRQRSRKPGFAALKEMALTCDFEGQVQWALGLERRVPFRVLKLDRPARLVLDLQEGSP